MRPQGSIAVIVRLAWPAGDELVPGRAIRWTEDHVMVMIKPIGAPSSTDELIVWLQTRDVYTSIPRRPYPRLPVRGRSATKVAGSPPTSADRGQAPYRPQGTDDPF